MPTNNNHNKIDPEIAVRLRLLRQSRGLSLRALAALTKITPLALSQIENAKSSPSVSTLKVLLTALGTTLGKFFSAQEKSNGPLEFVYRASELTHMRLSRGIQFLRVPETGPARVLECLREIYAPGADTGPKPYEHPGEETGFCLKGTIEVTVDGQTEVLGPGDAYYYRSEKPHRWRNIGNVPAEAVSCCTPPTF